MKRNLLLLLAGLTIALTSLTAQTDETSADFLTVAVLDFESPEARFADLGKQMATLLNVHLSMAENLMLVERAELDKLLGEQELGLSGTVSSASAAKVGHLTGANVLISGRVFTAGKEIVAVARIMSTETSRVFGEMVSAPSDESATALAAALSEKVLATLSSRAATLVVKPEPKEDVIAKLREQLAGRDLPSVSISIPEQHLNRAVVDPAAETEIGLILGQAGFQILNGSADVRIEGEAFSEFGMRRGNLVSCRARVEVKVIERSTGKILAMDRETEVAVDLSESIAAKTALQNAGAKLAQRLAPILAK